jgi:ubiquinone/menaquinone biosynthesis C-methylase UbiE
MLLVDIHGIITDLNAACRELLGSDAAGCRGQHYIYLVNRLRTKIDGEFLPPQGLANSYFRTTDGKAARTSAPVLETADLKLAVIECDYHSSRFGRARLRISELPRIDTATGQCAGSLVFLEPRDVAKFPIAVDRRLSHEVMWEVYASSYDRILSEMPFYQEVVERHCAAMEPAEIHTVLDVGAGTGIPTLRFVDLGKQVTAVDINRAMLQKFRSKLSPDYAAHVTVVEDTAEQLPQLQDASFDGVSVLLAFFDMDDPRSALMESLRVLRPGGTLIVTEPRACFNVDELMAAAEQSLRAKGLLERLAADWQRIQTVAPLIRDTVRDIQSRPTVTPVEQGWHAEAVRDILTRQDFVNLTFRESHLGNCATILGQKSFES